MSPYVATPALQRFVGVDAGVFADEHWSRRPLISTADMLARGFEDLLSPQDVDELIGRRGLRTPFFRVVKDGATLPADRYTRSAVVGGRSLADLVDADRVLELYADGATLVLQALHRSWPPLVDFCRRLAGELGHPTQCNAYVTPPGTRGFGAHHDTHDVFVLQVDGTKHWHVYEPVVRLPLPSQPSAAYAGPGGLVDPDAMPLLSTVLRPGDALYLPRGFIHAAETNEDRSIHLTVGVAPITWYDVLTDTLALAAEEEAFREALPPAADAEIASFLQSAATWLESASPDRVAELLRARLDRSLPAAPVGVLAQADAVRRLDPATRVRVRSGLHRSLLLDEGRVVLVLADRRIAMPDVVEPALRRLLDGSAYAAGDLTTDGLPETDVLVLLRRLLREQVVVPTP